MSKFYVMRTVIARSQRRTRTRIINLQLTPDNRCRRRAIICQGEENRLRTAVEAIIGTVLPELRAVEIRGGDAEECEQGDGERELDSHEDENGLWHAPSTQLQ